MEQASFCGECGRTFSDDARFCGSCGTARGTMEAPPPVPAAEPQAPLGESSDPTVVHRPEHVPLDSDTKLVRRQARTGGPFQPVTLVALMGDGRTLPEAPRVLLGRDPAGTPDEVVVSTDPSDFSVSKTHLAVERDAAGLWLVDQHSTNGVELERAGAGARALEPGERVLLRGGDRIRFGDQLVSIVAKAPTSASPTPPAAPAPSTPPLLAPPSSYAPPPPAVAAAEPAGAAAWQPSPIGALPWSNESAEVSVAPGPPPPGPAVLTDGESVALDEAPGPVLTGDALRRHTWAVLATGAVGVVDLLFVLTRSADWGLDIGDLLSWSQVLVSLAMCVIIGTAALPSRVGIGAAPFAATIAGAALAAESLSLANSGAVPQWAAWLTIGGALAGIGLLILAVVRADERSAGTGFAEGGLLVLGVAAASTGLSEVVSPYREAGVILLMIAVSVVSFWAWSLLRDGRGGWAVPTVAALLVGAAAGFWTDTLPGTVRSLMLLAVVAIVVTPRLREGTPWAGAGQSGAVLTPALGTSPGTGPVSVAWADLMAWLRTAWPAMLAAGGLFWITLLVVFSVMLIPVLILLSWASSADDGSSEISSDGMMAALLGALVLSQVVGTALAQALGLLTSQALAGAAAMHDGTSRVRGGVLAQRSLAGFARQFGTVLLYTLGVLAGSMLCVVPGVFLQVRWAFAIPAGMRDGVRGSEALAASWRLTEGRGWVTFGIQIIGGCLVTAGMIAAFLVAAGTQLLFGSAFIGSMAAILLTALGVTCNAVLLASAFRQFVLAEEGAGHDVRALRA